MLKLSKMHADPGGLTLLCPVRFLYTKSFASERSALSQENTGVGTV